ncbi:MAG: iron-containing redox enzyme family protein [Pseudomonas sp.]|uniref:iron-containing redox enzyme family protein n=1 Tax=Pseudomonas sp. TaxID=306 RepID=UPI0033984BAA
MLRLPRIAQDRPELQDRPWPPVPEFEAFTPEFEAFLFADRATQYAQLANLRADPEGHGQFIHQGLGTLYAYVYGYPDSPSYLRSDITLESALLTAKLLLEEEMLEAWLPVEPPPSVSNQHEAADYLQQFVQSNAGVYHELFDYLREQASREALLEFLRLEVCRNEVVDDEVALLVCGLQGNLKKVMASNLWDECGNGELSRFHTYWLRRLLGRLEDWDGLLAYRREAKPWFSSVTSNTFNALLTRPAYKLRGYGCFMTTEAWVDAHFERILGGLERVGLHHDDIAVYFLAHQTIDPHHTLELLDGLRHQVPALTPLQAQEVVRGAHLAVAGGVSQYQRVLRHLRRIDGA